MATVDRQHYALQTIFSFFLGLMVVAFIGVGVNTFYPSPSERLSTQLQSLYDEQNTLNAGGKTLSSAEQTRAADIQGQINKLQTEQRQTEQSWGLNTSIILVIFATLIMGVSLVRSDQLRVLSNGLLLGGLFTMVYGMGWTIASGSSYLRFFVVLFALAVAIGLGYAKFVWLRKGAAAPAATDTGAGAGVTSANVSGLEERVAALEAKTNAAAAALGAREGE
jgi:hypothetical protein